MTRTQATVLFLALAGSSMMAERPAVLTVGHGGGATFSSVQDAVNHAPSGGAVIRIAPGTYREKVHIHAAHIHLVGTGARPEDVVLCWNDAAATTGHTSTSGSVTVTGDDFAAENLTIENTWENENESRPEGAQAVALMLTSDRAVLDRVRLIGAQDTLYAASKTCHDPKFKTDHTPCQASRQLFEDCYIEGHVDYIFGDAKAVFDRCELHPRAHPLVMLTAQSRLYPEEDSGYTFLHCSITGKDDGSKILLGRPWRDYATVVFYDTDMERPVAAQGWAEWDGRLKTSTYREYKSHGRGFQPDGRVVVSPPLTAKEEAGLTPQALLAAPDGWNPLAEVKVLRQEVGGKRHR